MTSPFDSKTGGLRERKKAKTKAAIQRHAVRLSRAQDFGATTVEQIAEVSPSTVFRYFPAKEALVVVDPCDPVIFARFREQPPELSLVQAWRAASSEAFDDALAQLDSGLLR